MIITQGGMDFNIPDNIKKELVPLILNTESMNDEERQYWFDIIPSMNDTQIDRLFNILETVIPEVLKSVLNNFLDIKKDLKDKKITNNIVDIITKEFGDYIKEVSIGNKEITIYIK